MKRALAAVAGGLVVLLVVAELAAVPLATRVIGSAVGACTPYESLTVDHVARPVVPRLLLGRARDVRLTGTGLQVGELRVDRAELTIPQVVLPWALGSPDPGRAELDLRLREDDLDRALRAVGPLGGLTVELDEDVATIGSATLPVSVRLELEVREDGGLTVRPVSGDANWWDRLGIRTGYDPPPEVAIRTASIGADALTGTVEFLELPAVGGGGGCAEPVGLR